MTASDRTQPWAPGDTPALLVLNALAAAGVLVCWFGSAQEVRWHDGLYWLQGSILAVLLAAVADGLWLLAGMRQLRSRRRALIEAWPRVPVAAPQAQEPAVVTADRMTTYHRPGCLLVAGKAVQTGTRSAVERRHITPCGMCLP